VRGPAASIMKGCETDLPRTFRTADLWLIHAANCCSRYSSWTCRHGPGELDVRARVMV
jgi:hypothetical protein